MTMKINKLEIENVKRIRAVKIEPTQNGLTVIGGNNNQGKTSVLDSIAWALGGENFRPTEAMRHSGNATTYLDDLPKSLRRKINSKRRLPRR